MRLVDLPVVAETGAEYLRYRLDPQRTFRRVFDMPSGRAVLTEAERLESEVMMICVSRSCSPRLVLDL